MRSGVVVGCLLSVGISAPAAAPRGVRRDLYGDPLPAGAVARLGSMRLRHLTWKPLRCAFSQDGRLLVTLGPTIRVWDVATGRLTREIDHKEFEEFDVAFSPDGKKLI